MDALSLCNSCRRAELVSRLHIPIQRWDSGDYLPYLQGITWVTCPPFLLLSCGLVTGLPNHAL